MAKQPPLIQALHDYDALNRRRFHVPGHAGQALVGAVPGLTGEAYRFDQTEVEGLDVLSEPSECLLAAQQRVAEIFDVAQSWFLVNGSTVGLISAMLATLQPGDTVLLPRNVHRSVISGLILTGARPIWFLPEQLSDWGLWGAVSPERVEKLLVDHPGTKALLLTSPTYEGIGSDIAALSRLCRSHGVYLLVDEAHGSLWGFSEQLPPSACGLGADFVVHSLHKSAGSLTQTALAHLPHGSRISPEAYQQALNTLQTTSPSYLLLASLEATCHWLASPAATQRIEWMLSQVRQFRERLTSALQGFTLYDGAGQMFYDPSRLWLMNRYEPGERWALRLEAEHQVAYEATNPFGALYIAGLGLEAEDYAFLLNALQQEAEAIQARFDHNALFKPAVESRPLPAPDMALLPREAFFAPGISVPQEAAVGRIAKETIVHCPPGIPVLIPGERIQREHLPYLSDQPTINVVVAGKTDSAPAPG